MRLIDADALIEKFNEKTDMVECLVDARTAERFATFCALADAVEEMPTVDAEVVVRCKDCIYYDRNHNEVAEWMRCTHNHIDVSDYWYCKSGIKKVGWRRGTRQNWYMERNPDAKLDKNGVLKICPRKFDRNFNGQPIGCEKDRCDKPMCDRCRGTYWEHEVVFNENGLLRSLLE